MADAAPGKKPPALRPEAKSTKGEVEETSGARRIVML
jgi:hypothetical protein